jgi:hypothetical protein
MNQNEVITLSCIDGNTGLKGLEYAFMMATPALFKVRVEKV